MTSYRKPDEQSCIATPSEKDQATAAGKVHKNGEVWPRWFSSDASEQTIDTHFTHLRGQSDNNRAECDRKHRLKLELTWPTYTCMPVV